MILYLLLMPGGFQDRVRHDLALYKSVIESHGCVNYDNRKGLKLEEDSAIGLPACRRAEGARAAPFLAPEESGESPRYLSDVKPPIGRHFRVFPNPS
jgi:hypothetical protein